VKSSGVIKVLTSGGDSLSAAFATDNVKIMKTVVSILNARAFLFVV
jgi:hypothetical protein